MTTSRSMMAVLPLLVFAAALAAGCNGGSADSGVVASRKSTDTSSEMLGDASIFDSIRQGDLEDVGRHLDAGVSVHILDGIGERPLHWAAAMGDTQIAELLIDRGADVNAAGRADNAWDCGETPIHKAVQENHVECAQLLIAAGADPGWANCTGFTPLHYAVARGYNEMVSLLVNKHADVNAYTTIGHRWTALHSAISLKHLDLVEVLIVHGADPNAPDVNGYTPLHYAVRSGLTDIAEHLLEHGADVNRVTKTGRTALGLALWINDQPTKHAMQTLLNATGGIDGIHRAASNGDMPAVKIHLTRGVEMHIRCGAYGRTPLHAAADGGQKEIVKLLLELGASIDAIDKDGLTPLDLARRSHGRQWQRHGHLEVIEVLEAQARVQARGH